jgi:hypothetical protein
MMVMQWKMLNYEQNVNNVHNLLTNQKQYVILSTQSTEQND